MAFLLLHGLGGDRDQPLSLIGSSLAEGSRVFAPDLRAHGGSPLIGEPQDFSFTAMTAELATTVHQAGFADEPLTVIGISLGAALALQLARTGLLDVERLVLLRPAFTDQPIPPNLAVFPVIGELLHRHPADRAEAIFRTTGLYRSLLGTSPLGAAGALEQFRKPDARARAIRLVELPRNRAFSSEQPPATGLTSAITAATTIIAASRDPLHPRSVAELWQRNLPGSTMAVLPARDDGVKAYVAAIRAAVRAAVRSPARD